MNGVKNYLIYFVCVLLLFLFLFFSVRIFEEKNNLVSMKLYAKVTNYENEIITDDEDNVYITYPKFDYDVLNKEISNLINSFDITNNIKIDYNMDINEKLITMFFTIIKDGVYSYKNINYDIKSRKFCDNSIIFDFNTLGNQVLEKVKVKYSTNIYESAMNDNFLNASVLLQDEGVYIYFNSHIFNNILHKVFVFFPSENSTYVAEVKYDKVIAFTFDDGPSVYSNQMADTLIANDSKATFFELGNRMKYNQDIVKSIYDKGMEVASHTYAHKNLNKLTIEEIDEEINSTNVIFNEITGDNIKYLRPPYGNANDKVKSRTLMPLINWNVDTEDWLSRDSEKVYNHILENVKDGDIVLMHDIYPETLEAVKKVLPVLRERGFKITTVSELASLKGRVLEAGHIYRSIE